MIQNRICSVINYFEKDSHTWDILIRFDKNALEIIVSYFQETLFAIVHIVDIFHPYRGHFPTGN